MLQPVGADIIRPPWLPRRRGWIEIDKLRSAHAGTLFITQAGFESGGPVLADDIRPYGCGNWQANAICGRLWECQHEE